MSVDQLTGKLDEAIGRLLVAMAKVECSSTEYAKMADQLIKLYKAKDVQKSILIKEQEMLNKHAEIGIEHETKHIELEIKRDELNLRRRVSMDTWAVVGANLAGIVFIIGYERASIITSKAIGFVRKLH